MNKKKKITSIDVARKAGVSQTTVSLVLNEKYDSLSRHTIQKVIEAAESLNYMPSRRAAAKRGTIVIMSSSLPNPYYSELITSVEKAAEEKQLLSIVCNTYRDPNLEVKYLEIAQRLNAAGIIFTYMPIAYAAAQKLSKKITIVVVGDKSDETPLDAVEFDSLAAGKLLASKFIELGHKNIAFLSTPMNTGNIARVNRYRGFKQEMDKHKLSDHLLLRISEKEANYKNYEKENELAIGHSLATGVLNENPSITAFVGVNDMIAIGIMDAILSSGYRIPDDYSVAGFDNIHFSGLYNVGLTTIDYYSTIKGQDALEIILRKKYKNSIKDKNEPSVLFRMEYEPKLIMRKTLGKSRI